jgi:hypothetical protein
MMLGVSTLALDGNAKTLMAYRAESCKYVVATNSEFARDMRYCT